MAERMEKRGHIKKLIILRDKDFILKPGKYKRTGIAQTSVTEIFGRF